MGLLWDYSYLLYLNVWVQLKYKLCFQTDDLLWDEMFWAGDPGKGDGDPSESIHLWSDEFINGRHVTGVNNNLQIVVLCKNNSCVWNMLSQSVLRRQNRWLIKKKNVRFTHKYMFIDKISYKTFSFFFLFI